MERPFGRIYLAIGISLLIMALAFPTLAASPVTIRFAGWIGMEESTAKAFEQMVKEFEKQNPGVKVEYIGVAWENTRQQLLMMAAAGNAPDVAQIASPWIGQFASSGALEPLESRLSKSALSDYVDGVLENYTISGHTWAVPWVAVHDTQYYNLNLMRRAGLDTSNLPKTRGEFDRLVRQIAALGKDAKGNKIWGYVTSTDRSELTANIFNRWLFGFGGEVLDPAGKVIVNNEAGVRALSWFKKMVDDGVMPPGFAFRDQYNLMVNYQAGGFSDGSYARDVLRILSGKGKEFDKDFAVGMIPTGDTGKGEAIFHHHALVLFKQSKHKDVATKFIEFLSRDPKITKMYYQMSSLMPLSKSALADPVYSEDAFAKTFVAQLPLARLYAISRTPQYAAAADFVALAVSKAIGGGDPKAALDEAAQNLKIIYGQK